MKITNKLNFILALLMTFMLPGMMESEASTISKLIFFGFAFLNWWIAIEVKEKK